jgi:DNA polymerase-3 subunit delta
MTTSISSLLQELQRGNVSPVCIVDGEEPYDIERVTEYYENLLPEHERDFNLLVIYGKDATWADVINSCRRFPMFAERQVVILKDAAKMDDLGELASYIESPAPTTAFLIEHRFKKLDGRSKLSTLAKKLSHVAWATSDKLKDEKVPEWIMKHGDSIGFKVGREEAQILTSALGNDLQKISNEIEKVRINVPEQKALTVDLIRKYIGAGREYNVFEFPETFTNGDADKRYRMLAHFVANPKIAAMPLVLAAVYNHFSRLYNACFVDEKAPDAAKLIGVPPFKLREITGQARRIGTQRLEEAILLIADTSARFVGVGSRISEPELMKEFTASLEAILAGV